MKCMRWCLVMVKRSFLLGMALAVILSYAAPASAWQVNFQNKAKKQVTVKVFGQHLMDHDPDCTLTIPAGGSAQCSMPGGICPISYLYDGCPSYMIKCVKYCNRLDSRYPCCWNLDEELYEDAYGHVFFK